MRMDDSLPSYGQATNRDHWSLIASFVHSADLCSAALVCRKWNAIFSPLLWGNPASHFGPENDAVYIALVRFKRILMWASLETRSLTHTMHFHPAQAEFYNGPRPRWLYDILHRLPYLQSLVVSALPFFDYGSLSALINLSQPKPNRHMSLSTYQLRLLDASHCNNLTPATLAGALKLFPGLVFLDLSGTASARYVEVLSSLATLSALQILKLQRLWLSDGDIDVLTGAIGRRVRSLDVRHNRITDLGVRALIRDAIISNMQTPSTRSPTPRISSKIKRLLDSEGQEDYLRRRLTAGFASDLGIEASLGSGITHLYISNNLITVAGASGLLRCTELRVLDVGNVMKEVSHPYHPRYELEPERVSLPGSETLTALIEEDSKHLTYLRVPHAVVTKLACVTVAQAFEVEDTSAIVVDQMVPELDSTARPPDELNGNSIHQLSSIIPGELLGSTAFYAELEGSPVQPQTLANIVNPPAVRLRKASVPNNIVTELSSAVSPVLDFTGGLTSPVSPLMPHASQTKATTQPMNGLLPVPDTSFPILAPVGGLEVLDRSDRRAAAVTRPRRTYSGVLDEHQARIRYKQSEDHNLLPGLLSDIRTLVLTGVPAQAVSTDTAASIITFIKGCAEEEHWAALQASVGYALPPGPDRTSAERDLAQTLFPLRKLVLEMEIEHPPQQQTSPGWRRQSRGEYRAVTAMLSSTQDPDCETYLNAAKDDFSFFDSEECGQPDADALPPVPLVAFREKIALMPDNQASLEPERGKDDDACQPTHDVLAAIAQFRRAKKAEYEAALRQGHDHIDGHWSGIIEVVRPR